MRQGETMQGNFQQIQARYNQQAGVYQNSRNAITNSINAADREMAGLSKQMGTVPDSGAMIAKKAQEVEQKKNAFTTYHQYPLNDRRAEALGWIVEQPQDPRNGSQPVLR